MTERVAKAPIEDPDLLATLEALEDEHGSMAEALRHALREVGTTDADQNAHDLPSKVREGYEALREHYAVGDRVGLDAAKSTIATRTQISKSATLDTIIKPLRRRGYIGVHTGIQAVTVTIRDPYASDGGRDTDDRDDRAVSADSDDVAEAEARLDELSGAAGGEA